MITVISWLRQVWAGLLDVRGLHTEPDDEELARADGILDASRDEDEIDASGL